MPGISPSVSGTEMSKRIKKLIKKIRHRLQWPVAENRAPGIDTLSIDSDSRARIHRINVPGHDVRDIEYLHELGHAWLCETVSPMFSGQTFGTVDIEVLSLIQPASQAASDWFVDHWIYTMAPAEERREIEAVYSQMGAWLKDNNITDILSVTKDTIKDYQIALYEEINQKGQPNSVCSQNNRLKVVKSFFRYLAEENCIVGDPAKDISYAKIPKRLPRSILTKSETRRL